MLKQVVHRVTSGLIKVGSSEEPSDTTLMFRASITILISTDGIHKELLWFPSLKRKNVCVTLSPPPLRITMTVSIIQVLLPTDTQEK
jgi:hypothetical protein